MHNLHNEILDEFVASCYMTVSYGDMWPKAVFESWMHTLARGVACHSEVTRRTSAGLPGFEASISYFHRAM
jgi:hypothetical protein